MSQTLIRAFDNKNRPILAGNKPVERIYFNLVRLAVGETYRYCLPGFESIVVPMAGTCDLTVDGASFSEIGSSGYHLGRQSRCCLRRTGRRCRYRRAKRL